MTDTSPPSETVPPPPPPPLRRLVRRDDDRVIAGVASGIADYLQIDPVVVRIAFVILALTGGVGIVAYLAGWLLMPEAPTGTRPRRADVPRDEPRFWLGVALVVIASALLADELWRPDIVWPLALIGIGLLLFRHRPENPPPEEPDVAGAARTAQPPAAGSATPPEQPPQGETAAAQPSSPVRPRRSPSVLGRGTVAVGLVVGGVAALFDTAGVLDLGLEQYLALALTTVGAGLLVGSLWGRSPMLIVLGALIVPPLLATSVIDLPLGGGAGEHIFRPGAWHELRPTYELGAGELTLDLTGLEPSQSTTEVEASVGVGQIHVVVPHAVALRVEARAGAGTIDLFGSEREGFGVELVRELGPGPPQLRILLEVGTGEISVRSASR